LLSPSLLLLLRCRATKSEEEDHDNLLRCSALVRKKKEKKEGDYNRCHRLIPCAEALRRNKKKKKKGDGSHTVVTFFVAL
jgi:hypothetical protein